MRQSAVSTAGLNAASQISRRFRAEIGRSLGRRVKFA